MSEFELYNPEKLRAAGLVVTEHGDSNISVVRYHKSDDEWKTRTYGYCDRTSSFVKNHRSVAYNTATGCVLHCSPPRRRDDKTVILNTLKIENWIPSRYIDGTMISVFYHAQESQWYVSTRSRLHAACKFMSDRDFYELFCDAIPTETFTQFTERLLPEFSYTFVLVHPEHRHVIRASEPDIYLVSATSSTPKIGDVTVCSPVDRVLLEELGERFNVSVPEVIVPAEGQSLGDLCRSFIESERPEGIMLTPRTSREDNPWDRIRVLSNVFSKCVKLRGNSPSVQSNIVRLWGLDPKGDLLRDYETWYPEDKDTLIDVMGYIYKSADELKNLYRERHITKEKEHTDLPHWSRKPIWDLHGKYLRTREPNTIEKVYEYYRLLSPSFLNRILKQRLKEMSRATGIADVSGSDSSSC